MYATGDYHDAFYDGEGQGAYAATAERLAARLPPGARVLDFGCGAGHLLRALKARGLQAVGTEFSASAAANAADRSESEVFDLSDDRWKARGPWDCIHFGDVIEHLPDPASTLRDCLKLIVPGGLVSAEGPLEANRSPVHAAARLFGQLKRLRGRGHAAEFPPYHLIFASAATQRRFFKGLARLQEVDWSVSETGWPYRRNGALRNAIALASITISRVPLVGSGWGNRFVALYRLPSPRA